MNYTFDVTCPRCGGEVRHVAGSEETPPLTLSVRAVVACTVCAVEWLVVVELLKVRDQAHPSGERPPCGTESGYKAHTRRGEPTDPQCREAHRIHVAQHTPPGARHAKQEQVPA